MLRSLFTALLVATLVGCGGDDGPTGPALGTLFFKVDELTCTGTGTIEFFIDGTSRFTQTL